MQYSEKVGDFLKNVQNFLKQYSLPVLFENDSEKYPYSLKGTCFIVKFKDKKFIITAKHVIKNRTVNQVLIPYYLDSRDFFPICKKYTVSSYEELYDSDFADIVILKIEEKMLDKKEKNNIKTLDLTKSFSKALNKNDKLIYFGFPDELSEVDYDFYKINTTLFQREGIYKEASNLNGCGKIEFNQIDGIKSLNGLSGSPIYYVSKDYQIWKFSGMLIRGTKKSKTGYFIKAEIIYKFINKIV